MVAENTGRARSGRRRWPWWLAGTLVVVVLAPLLVAAWLVFTEAGLRAGVRLADRVAPDALVIDGMEGRLAGPLRIARLTFASADMRVEIDDLALDWQPRALLQRHVEVERLTLGRIGFSSRPGDEEPEPAEHPDAIELPVSLRVRHLGVGRIDVVPWHGEMGEEPEPTFSARDISVSLASDRRTHRIDDLKVSLPFAELAAAATVDTSEVPFALTATGAASGTFEERSFDATFDARGDLAALQVRVDATGEGLSGDADLVVAAFEAVPLRSLRVALGELDPAFFVPDAPTAALTLEADLLAENAHDWRFVGPMRVTNRRPDSVDNNAIPVSVVSARVDWSPAATIVEDLDVRTPGEGRLSGTIDWRPDREGDGFGQLSAALELAGIRTERIDARLPPAVIAGRLDAAGDETRQTGAVDLSVDDARISAQGTFEPGSGAAPATFSATGSLSDFDPAALVAGAPAADVHLDFDADGVLAEEPSFNVAWQFAPSTLDGRALGGKGRVTLAGERVAEADVALTLAGNTLNANGAWGRAGDTLEVDLDAPALEALGFDLRGSARLAGVLSGTFTAPAGEVEFSGDSLRLPGGIRVARLDGAGEAGAGLDGPLRVRLSVAQIANQEGDTLVRGASVTAAGTRSEHEIEIAVSTPEEDALGARLSGGLREPQEAGDPDGPHWEGVLAALDVQGRFPLSLVSPAELVVAPTRVALGALRIEAGDNGRIQLHETLWSPERILARGSLTGLQVIEQGAARRRGPTPLTLGAEWDLRLGDAVNGEVKVFREAGDLTVPGELDARVGLEHLELWLNAVDNRLAVSWEARGSQLGTVNGSLTAMAERDPEAGWRLAPDAALLGSAKMEMPSIAWLARLMQEEMALEGSLQADFSISGTPAEPVATGRIAGQDLAVALLDQGVQLAGGELLAEFDRDRLRLTRLEFISPNQVRPRDPRVPVDRLVRTPGRLSATGEIALESGRGNFAFEADRLPILQRRDRWLILSGEGSATSTWTSLSLDADFRADAGYIELADTPPPSLSEDVVIAGEDDDEDAPAEGGLQVSADVRVSLGDDLYLSALGLDTRLTGELRLRLSDGQPLTAVGTVSTEGGVFRGYGQNLTVERGLINFQGPLDNPGLNVVALRKGLAVEAGISVTGTARRPVIRLVSSPEVPDAEKLSWIVLGRAPTGASSADLGLLIPAAQALLGGPGSGPGMTEQLSRSLGLDEFGIGQGEMGAVQRAPTSRVVGGGTMVTDEGVGGQVLTLGKRLSTDLFLSFEQSLGGAESLVKLSYQLSRRVSVVARGGSDTSADVYYTISFR